MLWCYEELARKHSGILAGSSGLVWHGVCTLPRDFLMLVTTEETHVVDGSVKYKHVEDTDPDHFLTPWEENPKLLIPSLERSIVWYQMYDAVIPFDDEQLMYALEEYARIMKGDFSKLIEVAKFYGREKEIKASIRISKDFDPMITPFYGFELQDIDK